MQHVDPNILNRCIISNNETIINLNEKETIFVKKFVKFKILRGSCTFMGYNFTESDNIYTTQIPKWHPPEPLTTLTTNNNSLVGDSVTISFTNYVSPFNTYSFVDCVENTIFCDISTNNLMRFSKIIPDLWHKCADLVPKNGCIALHGEKGVGKSTATIYLANYLLNKCSNIAIIDVDIGQPLFTVPGIISLHILNKPILRPGYSMKAEDFIYSKEILIGDISISNPKKILQGAVVLEKYLRKAIVDLNIVDYKVLINTGGWISDTGGQFFDCITMIFGVNVILSILSKPDNMGYKRQEINFLLDVIPNTITDTNQPEIVLVNSYKIDNISVSAPRPSDLRWLRVAAYLNPALGDLLEIHPFTHYEFFSGIPENKSHYFIKDYSLLTPPTTFELKMSNLTFYLPNGTKLYDFQLKNHFLAGCMAALFMYTETGDELFENIFTSTFLLVFIHSVNDDKLLILIPKHKSTTNLDLHFNVILCPMLGFDPQFPTLGRSSHISFVPFERNVKLHLTKNLGTGNCSRRGVKKRSHEEDKI